MDGLFAIHKRFIESEYLPMTRKADLNLNDFRTKVNEDFGPFIIDFGSESDPRSVKFNSPVIASPEKQVSFITNLTKLGAIAGGAWGDPATAEALIKELIGDEDATSKSEEEIAVLLLEGAASICKKTMRDLATNKRDFDAFAKELGGGFMEWFMILTEYSSKYNLIGTADSEGNAGK